MFTRHTAVLLLVLVLACSLPAQYSRRATTRHSTPTAWPTPEAALPSTGSPPLKIPRIATEWAAAYILARYCGSFGVDLALEKYVSNPYARLSDMRILTGVVSGTQIGTLTGIYGIAAEDDQTASLPITMAGGLAGSALGIAATAYTGNPQYIFAGSATGAVIGFNLTRRYVPVDPSRPYLTNRQFLVQLLSGTAGACLGFLTVDAAYRSQFDKQDNWEGGVSFGGLILGTSIGIPAGSTMGVYTAGSLGSKKGSLIITGLGSALGTLVGVSLATIGVTPWWSIPVFPAFCAMAGFNATRHYRQGSIPAQLPAPVDPGHTYQSRPLFVRQVAAGTLGGSAGFIAVVSILGISSSISPGNTHAAPSLYTAGLALGIPVGCTLYVQHTDPACSGGLAFVATGAGSVAGLLGANYLNHRFVPNAISYPVLAALGASVANHLARLSGICGSAAAISTTPFWAMQNGTPLLGVQLNLP